MKIHSLEPNGIYEEKYPNGQLKRRINYANYLADTLFCNDKTLASSSIGSSNTALGYRKNKTYYSSTERLLYSTGTTSITTVTPTLKCAEKANDNYSRFTTTKTMLPSGKETNGNLKYPIGLLTADEVSFAGAYKYTQANKTYYQNQPNHQSHKKRAICHETFLYHDFELHLLLH